MTKERIVIIGGGAGGLELATRLGNTLGRKKLADIVLIDANATHLWKPRLHEVAAGVLNSNIDELNYSAHAYQHHFQFILGRMLTVDRDKQSVVLAAHMDQGSEILPQRNIHYDKLVIALGSQTNDFGTNGARDHCVFLDQRKSAEHFRQSFMNAYWQASVKHQQTGELSSLSVVIVGAGATGVELAAELEHTANELNKYGFTGIPVKAMNITIVEAAPRVMTALTEKSSAAIQRQLDKLNITVLTNELVTEVTADGLQTKSGKFIPATLKVWSAGVKAPELLRQLDGLESNRINQLCVTPYLQSTLDENIYAMGDCAECIPEGHERPLPPRAQTASQQASYLAKSLQQQIKGIGPKPFTYKDKGSLISLSKHSSVGQLMGNLSGDFTFEGKVARLFYITLYRLHQIVLHGYIKTVLFILRDRINQKTGPSMKLH